MGCGASATPAAAPAKAPATGAPAEPDAKMPAAQKSLNKEVPRAGPVPCRGGWAVSGHSFSRLGLY